MDIVPYDFLAILLCASIIPIAITVLLIVALIKLIKYLNKKNKD